MESDKKLVNKSDILGWVANHMPVEVDGKKFYLHAGALLDPKDFFTWVFDKDPYEQEGISSTEPISIKPVETSKLKILL